MTPRVLSLHRGKAEPLREGKTSGIRKTVIDSAEIGVEGIAGDRQVDLRYHGGPFKAICVYAREYYPRWRAMTGSDMPYGSFGENFSVEGLMDDEVCVGDVYTYGDTRLQVTAPRGPCNNLSIFWGMKDFHPEVKKQRRTGFYLRVLQPGVVGTGLPLELVERPHPDWTLIRFWDVLDHAEAAAEEIETLLAEPALDPAWHAGFRSRLKRVAK